MIVAIGLLILAVLLFGAGRVLGAAGRLLSILSALIGFGFLAAWVARIFDMEVMQIAAWTIGAFFACMVAYGVICELRGVDPATGEKRR